MYPCMLRHNQLGLNELLVKSPLPVMLCYDVLAVPSSYAVPMAAYNKAQTIIA